jgi:prepilin-type N-terminal cleavage/methylation domain-containing protein
MMRERSDHRLRHRLRSGFTLVEVTIVLGILGVVLGLGLPSYLDYTSNHQVRAAAQSLASNLGAARQEAITRRTAVTVSLSVRDPACVSAGRAASYTISRDATLISRTCLEQRVGWVSPPQGGVIFQSTGGSPVAVVLRLRSTRTGRIHTVSIAAETGVITHDAR